MRLQLLLTSAFAVAASAAGTTSVSSTVVSTAAAPTRSLTAVEKCVDKCDAGDVTCQAACVGVPHPNASVMNQTTDCVAGCDQGSGSASDNVAYAKCRNACISSYINTSTLATLSAGEGGPTPASVAAGGSTKSGSNPTDAAATRTGSDSAATGTDSSETDSGDNGGSSDKSASASGSSSTSTSTAGAFNIQAGPVGGLAALLLAVLAL